MNLREWLEKSDISVAAFSEMIDIDRTYMHQVIRNPSVASKRLLWRIYRFTREEIELFEKLKEKKCPKRVKGKKK